MMIFRLTLLCGLLWAGVVQAEVPAVPDPGAWSALPADRREAQAHELRQKLKAATPEERREFRARLRERLSSLPPEQRREMSERLREDWKSMSETERERLHEGRWINRKNR